MMDAHDTNAPTQLIRLPEVLRRVGLSRSTIYELVRRGAFPAPVQLTARAVAWRATAVDAWIAQRATTSAKRDASRP